MIFGLAIFGTTNFSDFSQRNPNAPVEHWDLVCSTNPVFSNSDVQVSSWNGLSANSSAFSNVNPATNGFNTITNNSDSWTESASSSSDQVHSGC